MGRGGKGRIPRTPICVDSFAARPVLQELAAEGIQTQPLFFLTHLHGDHVAGLTSSWNFGFIFCSPVTRELLLKQFAGWARSRLGSRACLTCAPLA
jgi:glyoxylase-like metal-dependent hydrolase (beta-lactamase superfamily II)